MLAPSDTALTLAFWLHMLSTAAWVGGLGLAVLMIFPAARRSMEPAAYAKFSVKLSGQIQSLGWICLMLLTGTGMFQLSSNPNYNGFLAINNRWAVAILTKHILFGAVLLVSAYLTWGIGPALKRQALVTAHKGPGDLSAAAQLEKLQQREALLMKANIGLGVAILVLTALARIS